MKLPRGVLVGLLVIAWPGLVVAGAPALQQLADQVNEELGRVWRTESSEPTLGIVVEGDETLQGREGRLVQELERLLTHRLRQNPALGRVVPLDERERGISIERVKSLGVEWLMRCVLTVDSQRVSLTVDLMSLQQPLWERLLEATPVAVAHHLFAAAPLDDEISLLVGKERVAPVLGSWHLQEVLYLPQRVLDVGLGDLDDRDGDELVLLLEDSVDIYSIEAEQVERLASYDLSTSAQESVRCRDPAGSVVVVDFNHDGHGEVFFKSFNRRQGGILSWSGARLQSVRQLDRVPLCVVQWEGRPVVFSGAPEPGTNHYQPRFQIHDINASSGREVEFPSAFSSMRCAQAGPQQPPQVVVVDMAGGLWRLVPGAWQAKRVEQGAGAGFGLVDLDRDDQADLVLSEPTPPDQPDSLRILSAGEVVWRSRDVIGAIVAVAGGDISGHGAMRAALVSWEPGGQASRVYLLGR